MEVEDLGMEVDKKIHLATMDLGMEVEEDLCHLVALPGGDGCGDDGEGGGG